MAVLPRYKRPVPRWTAALLALLASYPLGQRGTAWARGTGEPKQVGSEQPGKESTGRARSDVREDVPIPVWGAAVVQASGGESSIDAEGAPKPILVSKSGTVEMHVSDLPLSTVLEILSVQARRNIIATPGVTGTVTAHLYNVTFEEALRAVLASNAAGFREVDGFIYVYTLPELAEISASKAPPTTRVFPLYFCPSKDALAVVTPMLSDVGTAVAAPEAAHGLDTEGPTGGDSMARRDYLAVRDRPDVLGRIEETLGELDLPPTQVLVEATILAVTLNEDNALGVDFTLVGGVDLELLGAVSNAVTDLNLGVLPTDRLERFNANVTSDVTGRLPDGGLTIGVVKDQVGVFVRALETITDTVVLANPKVLALNRQRAQVIVGRRDGYLTTTVTETQAIQNIEFLETGTQLIFRPFVGKNGIVRMELHPEDSVGSVTGGLPSEQTTEVTTNVVVEDGQTILIGGLFREVRSDLQNQLPLLGSLPVVGALFQGRRDQTTRQEVIILLTVHVISDQSAYARAGTELREDVERIRVGMRRHMMWHGRERLAQTHFRRAREYLARGDSDLALWSIRMALHNDPLFVSAIQMKEDILASREWEDDGSAAREFIHKLIRDARGSSPADLGRAAVPSPDSFTTVPAGGSKEGGSYEVP